jgi:hypothetical protein
VPSAAPVVSKLALPSVEPSVPLGSAYENDVTPDSESLPLAASATVPRSHWPAAGRLQLTVGLMGS